MSGMIFDGSFRMMPWWSKVMAFCWATEHGSRYGIASRRLETVVKVAYSEVESV